MQLIVDLPYWRRMWIIQELYHAKDIIVWYGESFVHFDYICGLMGVAQDSPSAIRTLSELFSTSLQAASFHRELKKLCQTIRSPIHDASTANKATFCTLIDNFSFANCSDTKDRVYALRSMLSWKDQLHVDYTKGLTDLLVHLLPLIHQEQPTTRRLFKTWQVLIRGLNLDIRDLNDLVNLLSYLSQDEDRYNLAEDADFQASFHYLLSQRVVLTVSIATCTNDPSENGRSKCSLCDCHIDPPFNGMNIKETRLLPNRRIHRQSPNMPLDIRAPSRHHTIFLRARPCILPSQHPPRHPPPRRDLLTKPIITHARHPLLPNTNPLRRGRRPHQYQLHRRYPLPHSLGGHDQAASDDGCAMASRPARPMLLHVPRRARRACRRRRRVARLR